MEPDKFEKHIKAKLNQREIQPSDEAWEKITAQLNSSSTTRIPGYFWYGIAASMLVLIGISAFYLSSRMGNKVDTLEIVDTPNDTLPNTSIKKGTNNMENKAPDRIVLQEETLQKSIQTENEKDNLERSFNNTFLIKNENEIVTKNPDKIELKDTLKTVLLPEDVLNRKIAEVVAQVDLLERSNAITDDEIDSLLFKAQQDILRDKLFNKDKTVNAMALLTEVEDELDQSFRDQIFKSLKTGFLKVRTAVADRNN